MEESNSVLAERIIGLRRDLERMEEGLRWLRRAVFAIGIGVVGSFLTANLLPPLGGG